MSMFTQSERAHLEGYATSGQSATWTAPKARGKPKPKPTHTSVPTFYRGVAVTVCPPRSAKNPMRMMKTNFGPLPRAVSEANRVGAGYPAVKPKAAGVVTMFRPRVTQ